MSELIILVFTSANIVMLTIQKKEVIKNNKLHNPASSLLIGEIENDDIIKVRKK